LISYHKGDLITALAWNDPTFEQQQGKFYKANCTPEKCGGYSVWCNIFYALYQQFVVKG